MRVTFFGVRGSTPCSGDEIRRHGGNTSCVGVDVPGEDPIALDMGTGMRYFGARCDQKSFRGTALLTHLHWDHTQGLAFFTPLLCPDAQLDVYGPVQEDGRAIAQVFADTIRPPMFPLTVADLPGTVRFHDTAPGRFDVGSVAVTAREVPHKGVTLGYRLKWRGHSIAYISDHQQPYDGGFGISDGALELAQGVDLLIHDSQYTAAEFVEKSTWGHCTVDYALRVAATAGVKRLALFHHDPSRDDASLDTIAGCARAFGERAGFEVVAAAEGLSLTVG